jgi:hypothetical protein
MKGQANDLIRWLLQEATVICDGWAERARRFLIGRPDE